MKELNFIGIGGAVNTELGGNCCYYKDLDSLLIIDMCEGVTEKIKRLNILNGVKNIYIIITHTHFDHVAGLGVFIWYSNFVLGIKPKILYSNINYAYNLKRLLSITGVDIKYVEFIKDSNFCINNLSLKLKHTTHSPNLDCYGIMFKDELGKYYYTGDTNDIEYIKKLNNNSDIIRIYTEVSTETFDVHIKYDDIKTLDKNKLILMHFNTMELYKKAIDDGFKVARVINYTEE